MCARSVEVTQYFIVVFSTTVTTSSKLTVRRCVCLWACVLPSRLFLTPIYTFRCFGVFITCVLPSKQIHVYRCLFVHVCASEGVTQDSLLLCLSTTALYSLRLDTEHLLSMSYVQASHSQPNRAWAIVTSWLCFFYTTVLVVICRMTESAPSVVLLSVIGVPRLG